MASYNKTILVGNLTRDPGLKYTPDGKGVCKFCIAVNHQYKGKDGETKKEADYFVIITWGKTAENCSKFLSKGRTVLVDGRLKNRTYETQDKQKRNVTEIIAETVTFLSPGHGKDQKEQGPDQTTGEEGFSNPDEVPF